MTKRNLFTKYKQTYGHRKQIDGYQRRKEGNDKLGIWDQQRHTTIYKIDINNKDLLNSTGNYIQT